MCTTQPCTLLKDVLLLVFLLAKRLKLFNDIIILKLLIIYTHNLNSIKEGYCARFRTNLRFYGNTLL